MSREQNLPLNWSEQQGLAWKVDLPEWGTSTPAIWKDAIFLTSQQDDRLLLIRLNVADGRTVWTRELGKASVDRMPLRAKKGDERLTQRFHELQNMASPSPVTDGEVVIAHYGNGELVAVDFDGKELWRHNLQKDHGGYTIWWGHANSPTLVGDLVINVCMQDSLQGVNDQPSPSYLVAYDKRTGSQRWKTMRMTKANAEECDSYTTPLLTTINNKPQLVVMGGNQLDAYNPDDGKQLWKLEGLVGGRVVTGPTADDGLVFATRGMKGELVAVRPESGELAAARNIVWKKSDSTPDSSTPVVVNDLLFTVTDDGIARAVDAPSGTERWKRRLGAGFKASPVAADGRIYFLDMKGKATVVAASPTFEKLAENQLDDETIASPAISDGKIFIRGRKHLYCITK